MRKHVVIAEQLSWALHVEEFTVTADENGVIEDLADRTVFSPGDALAVERVQTYTSLDAGQLGASAPQTHSECSIYSNAGDLVGGVSQTSGRFGSEPGSGNERWTAWPGTLGHRTALDGRFTDRTMGDPRSSAVHLGGATPDDSDTWIGRDGQPQSLKLFAGPASHSGSDRWSAATSEFARLIECPNWLISPGATKEPDLEWREWLPGAAVESAGLGSCIGEIAATEGIKGAGGGSAQYMNLHIDVKAINESEEIAGPAIRRFTLEERGFVDSARRVIAIAGVGRVSDGKHSPYVPTVELHCAYALESTLTLRDGQRPSRRIHVRVRLTGHMAYLCGIQERNGKIWDVLWAPSDTFVSHSSFQLVPRGN